MVSRLDEERLCLCPPIKLLTNNLLNSSKELTKLGGILLNHTRAGPLRVVGKALHIISSGTPWRCIIVLKVAMWSKGSHIPSYDLRKASWTSEGESDRWWVQWKGSQSYELNPPLDLSFLYSLSSHPWPFSSSLSLFPDAVPFAKWYPLTGSQVQRFLCLLDSGYALWHFCRDAVSLSWVVWSILDSDGLTPP